MLQQDVTIDRGTRIHCQPTVPLVRTASDTVSNRYAVDITGSSTTCTIELTRAIRQHAVVIGVKFDDGVTMHPPERHIE